MYYALIADILVFFHLLYVLFVVIGELAVIGGGIMKMQWVRNFWFRVVHLAAIVLVAFEDLAGILCPLTEWEYRLRSAAGQSTEQEITFVARLVRMVLFYDFPQWFFTLLYTGFALIVAATFIFIPPGKPARRPGNT